MTKVIDISSWQDAATPTIDFAAVKESGVSGVMIKFTQGVHYVNPKCREHAVAAHAAGLIVGAYHLGEPGVNTPEAEAAFFLREISGIDIDLAVALDLENFGKLAYGEAQIWCEKWLEKVKGRAGVELIYLNEYLYTHLIGAPWAYKLWAARFEPTDGTVAFMTQTGQSTVNGINGLVDINELTSIRALNPGSTFPTARAATVAYLPTLQSSDIGPAVYGLQTLLRHLAFNILVDGIFDENTQQAVEHVQQDNGLPVTGICDAELWSVLTPFQGLATADPELAADIAHAAGETPVPQIDETVDPATGAIGFNPHLVPDQPVPATTP